MIELTSFNITFDIPIHNTIPWEIVTHTIMINWNGYGINILFDIRCNNIEIWFYTMLWSQLVPNMWLKCIKYKYTEVRC